jgi:hypothetical protein
MIRDFGGRIRRHFTNRRFDRKTNGPLHLSRHPLRTIVPSGSTTTKKGFNRSGVADCSALSSVIEKSSLAIPDRIKLPDELLCRIIEIATTIMATVTIRDNRIKTILS